MANLGVTIFDISGSRLKEISIRLPAHTIQLWDKIGAQNWHLDNGKELPVAPGIYLALCKVTFDDGTPEVVNKFKLAVIK